MPTNSNPISNPTAANDAQNLVFQPGLPAQHYVDRLAEIRALPEAQVLPVNLDVLATAATVLGVLPELRALQDELVARLVGFDPSRIDHLESLALATYYTHTARLAERRRSEPLPQLSERGAELRTSLHIAATALAQKQLVHPSSLDEYRGGQGYLNLSSDLGLLVKIFRDAWNDIQGKTAITLEEIDLAEVVGAQLVVGVGVKEQAPSAPVVSTLDRQRAFTLLVNEYDELRRAVAYVRWKEKDADEIVPSLYSGRGNGNHKPKAEPPIAPPAASPESFTAPSTMFDAQVPRVGQPSAPTPSVESGFPGTSPFKIA